MRVVASAGLRSLTSQAKLVTSAGLTSLTSQAKLVASAGLTSLTSQAKLAYAATSFARCLRRNELRALSTPQRGRDTVARALLDHESPVTNHEGLMPDR